MTTKMNVADPKVARTLRHSWLLHVLLVLWFPGLQLVPSDGANVPHACEYFLSLLFNFLELVVHTRVLLTALPSRIFNTKCFTSTIESNH